MKIATTIASLALLCVVGVLANENTLVLTTGPIGTVFLTKPVHTTNTRHLVVNGNKAVATTDPETMVEIAFGTGYCILLPLRSYALS